MEFLIIVYPLPRLPLLLDDLEPLEDLELPDDLTLPDDLEDELLLDLTEPEERVLLEDDDLTDPEDLDVLLGVVALVVLVDLAGLIVLVVDEGLVTLVPRTVLVGVEVLVVLVDLVTPLLFIFLVVELDLTLVFRLFLVVPTEDILRVE